MSNIIIKTLEVCSLMFLMTSAVFAQTQPHFIKLINSLDRPDDGYCLDVLGTGRNMRVDLPLIGHNCKSSLYSDQEFVFNKNGTISFPEANLCITVLGVNKYVLDYSSVTLQRCYTDTPFVKAAFMQDFEYTKDKKIKHKNSSKCLEMGNDSSVTFSPEHKWRNLYMKECSKTNIKRSTWQFYQPK